METTFLQVAGRPGNIPCCTWLHRSIQKNATLWLKVFASGHTSNQGLGCFRVCITYHTISLGSFPRPLIPGSLVTWKQQEWFEWFFLMLMPFAIFGWPSFAWLNFYGRFWLFFFFKAFTFKWQAGILIGLKEFLSQTVAWKARDCETINL